MSIDPKIWGEAGWTFLHSVVLAYPSEPTADEKEDMRVFLGKLPSILPCEECRANMKKHMEKYPLNNAALESRLSLAEWINKIHAATDELILEKRKKAEAKKKATRDKEVEASISQNPFTNIVMVAVVIIIIICVLYRNEIRERVVSKNK